MATLVDVPGTLGVDDEEGGDVLVALHDVLPLERLDGVGHGGDEPEQVARDLVASAEVTGEVASPGHHHADPRAEGAHGRGGVAAAEVMEELAGRRQPGRAFVMHHPSMLVAPVDGARRIRCPQ